MLCVGKQGCRRQKDGNLNVTERREGEERNSRQIGTFPAHHALNLNTAHGASRDDPKALESCTAFVLVCAQTK